MNGNPPMALSFRTIQEPLEREIKILDTLIYRSKNQHRSSVILRKMTELKRLLRATSISRPLKSRITVCAKNLYIAASSSLSMGYFIPLCLCVLGVSARIFYLVEKCQVAAERSSIDEIFS